MRVLILSYNTGKGHNFSENAICEAFEEKEVSCQMEDALHFISHSISRQITSGVAMIYRPSPKIFHRGYKYSENHPDMFESQSKIYQLLASGSEGLYGFILQKNFDAVICTHVFSALMVTEVMRQHNRFLNTYFVATDYACSPGCAQSDLDVYFIPDISLEDEFIRCGIPSKKLVPSGIPIRKEFYNTLDKMDAKRRLGLDPVSSHLLIMCGSMGDGPIKQLVQTLSKSMSENCCATVICGTNRRLKGQLARAYVKDPRIRVRGFIDDTSTLMASADLFLTNPGGISVTEAAQKRLPMVFTNAAAGCEAYNMRFYMHKGVAITADTPKELAHLTAAILSDRDLLESMTKNYQGIGDNNPAAETIVEFIMKRWACCCG